MVATIRVIRSKRSDTHKVSRYYLSGESKHNYYSEGGNEIGVWHGKGAARLGLHGKDVNSKDFLNVLLGKSPEGKELRSPKCTKRQAKSKKSKAQAKKTAGKANSSPSDVHEEPNEVRAVDLTFSACKSFSIVKAMFELYDPEIARQMEQAYVDSVKDTMDFAEKTLLTSRRGRNGAIRAPGELASAIFVHDLPRNNLEPQTHAHVIVAAVVKRDDHNWGSLHSKALRDNARALGPFQNCQLAHLLQERLGFDIEIPIDAKTGKPSSTFEIKGITREMIEACSTRRKEIEAMVSLNGGNNSDAKARANANLKTRKAKVEYSDGEILQEWKRLSEKLGLSKERSLALMRGPRKVPKITDKEIRASIREAANKLVISNATFRQFDLLRDVCERLQGRATGERIYQVLSKTITGSHFVHVADTEKGPTYTTRHHWDREKKLMRSLEVISRTNVVMADSEQVDLAIAKKPFLNEEQKHAIRYSCLGNSGVSVIIGAAGTGKTTMLGVVAEAYRESGKKVLGLALSGSAARELASVGMEARTIASFLKRIELKKKLDPEAYGTGNPFVQELAGIIDPNTVAILDEASMVSLAMLLQVSEAIQELGGRLVLVGDPKQLTSIDAACPLTYAAATFGYAKLEVNQRQVNYLDRVAVDLVRQGKIADAVHSYEERGLFNVSPTRREAVEKIVNDWIGDGNSARAERALVLTQTNQDAEAINAMIQGLRLLRGDLETRSCTSGERTFYQNDRILFKEAIGQDVKNGDFATILEVNLKRGEVSVRLDSTEAVEIVPIEQLHKATLGYSSTTHASQGKTFDFAYSFLGGSLSSSESFYVQVTRARFETKLYCDEAHAGPKLETIIRSLERSEQKLMAHQEVLAGSNAPWQSEQHRGLDTYVNEHDRRAVELIRQRKFAEAFASYDESGKLHLATSTADTFEQMATVWFNDGASTNPERSIFIAPSERVADTLNECIQAQRFCRGELGNDVAKIGNRFFHAGDRIIFHGNVNENIERRDMGTIVQINTAAREFSVRLDRNQTIETVPFEQCTNARLGYAAPFQAIQGKQFDRSYVLLRPDQSSAKDLCNQLSCARQETKIFSDEVLAGPKLENVIRSLENGFRGTEQRKTQSTERNSVDATMPTRPSISPSDRRPSHELKIEKE